MMPNIVDRVQENADNIEALKFNIGNTTDKLLTIISDTKNDLTSQVSKLSAQVDVMENDIKYLKSQQKASVQYHKLNGKRVIDTIEKLEESIGRRFDNTLDTLEGLDKRIDKIEEKMLNDAGF